MNKRRRFKAKKARRIKKLTDMFNFPWHYNAESKMYLVRYTAKKMLAEFGIKVCNY